MDYQGLKDTVVKNVCEAIRGSIDNTSFISTLYSAFTAEFDKTRTELRNRDKLLIDTFKDLAQVFGVEFKDDYSVAELGKNLMEFKGKIESLSKTQRPKQRYLCISGSDDCGHSYCDCVTEKNVEYVKIALGNTEFDNCEYLYQDDSVLLLGMSTRNETTVDSLLDMSVDALLDAIDAFFEELVKDESICLGQFSEYLACLVNDRRHSGSSFTWVLL